MRTQFKLNSRAIAALMISSAFSTSAYSAVGKVDFVVGGVNAKAADGKSRILTKGAALESGDLIETNNGRVQIRFNDGAYISLQPQTQFRIDEYRYNEKNEAEEKGFFSLFKGGLRTITGIIGRANKKSYQLNTPTATIGIRGTAYTVTQNGDALNVSVGKGQIFVSNDAGGLLLSSGQSAFIAGPRNSPLIISDKPVLPPNSDSNPAEKDPQPDLAEYTVGDVRNSSGSPLVVSGNGLASGSGYALAKAKAGTVACDTACGAASVSATFDETGQLTQFNSGAATFSIGSATYEGFVVGPIGWGRWVNGTIVSNATPTTLGSGQGEHVIIGIPTASMPVSGTADYNVLGYSTPTFSDGVNMGLGVGSVSGKMTANFGTSNVALNLDFAFSGGSGTSKYNLNMPTMTITGAGFAATGAPTFVTGPVNICAGSGCGGNVSGFFAGDNASHAGLVYQLTSGSFVQTNGAVTFVKQ